MERGTTLHPYLRSGLLGAAASAAFSAALSVAALSGSPLTTAALAAAHFPSSPRHVVVAVAPRPHNPPLHGPGSATAPRPHNPPFHNS